MCVCVLVLNLSFNSHCIRGWKCEETKNIFVPKDLLVDAKSFCHPFESCSKSESNNSSWNCIKTLRMMRVCIARTAAHEQPSVGWLVGWLVLSLLYLSMHNFIISNYFPAHDRYFQQQIANRQTPTSQTKKLSVARHTDCLQFSNTNWTLMRTPNKLITAY